MRSMAPTADTTVARPAAGIDIGVLGVVSVASGAVCLSGLVGPALEPSITAANVRSVGHRFKVIGIHAGRCSAKVVQVHPRGDWPIAKGIRNSMRGDNAGAVPNISVPERGCGRLPHPALGVRTLRYLRPKAFLQSLRGSGESPRGIVLHAVIVTGVV